MNKLSWVGKMMISIKLTLLIVVFINQMKKHLLYFGN